MNCASMGSERRLRLYYIYLFTKRFFDSIPNRSRGRPIRLSSRVLIRARSGSSLPDVKLSTQSSSSSGCTEMEIRGAMRKNWVRFSVCSVSDPPFKLSLMNPLTYVAAAGVLRILSGRATASLSPRILQWS
jgi:hypothetical protein